MPLSEFSLIHRYFSSLGRGPGVALSVGDDCALLEPPAGQQLVTSVDTVVAGVHFLEDDFPEDVGYRAVVVAASDLAAMGAEPLGMTLALTLPDADELWLHAFSEGVAQAVTAFRLPLVGGDTTRGPLTISVQVLGCVPPGDAVLRSGAQPGDAVYVSGTLGDAAAALALLKGEWQAPAEDARFLAARLYRPPSRLSLGQQLRGRASAAIDISDGLVADAGHIAAASGVGIVIDTDALPLSPALQNHPSREQALLWALTGGDDYELCYCLPQGITAPGGVCIGRVVSGEGVDCGMQLPGAAGYRHFEQDT
ncbi:MAG: thiamine-phosphate kinase [Halioglobus sp.]